MPYTPDVTDVTQPQGTVDAATANDEFLELKRALTVYPVLGSRFGAVGDGVTNDRNAVQSAFDYLRDTGLGRILFPTRHYKLNSGVTLLEDTPNAAKQFWDVDLGGSILDFSALAGGSTAIKIGADSIGNVHERGTLILRNGYILGPETNNPTVAGGITFPAAATTTIGIETDFALDVFLINIQVRRFYKAGWFKMGWPINTQNLNSNGCYIGWHFASTATLGTHIGMSAQAAAFGILLQPDTNDDVITAQSFTGTRLENCLRGVTMDPRDNTGVVNGTIRGISFNDTRFEQIAYDLWRMGKAFDYANPQNDTADRAHRTQQIHFGGGEWQAPVTAPGVSHFHIRSSNNSRVTGITGVLPVGDKDNISGILNNSSYQIVESEQTTTDAGVHVLYELNAINMYRNNGQRTFTAADTTPGVGNGNFFKTANVAPTVITNFDDGKESQVIHVVIDANTTIQANATLRLNGNFVGPGGITLAKDALGLWQEMGRSGHAI